jgi:hypothetical protein
LAILPSIFSSFTTRRAVISRAILSRCSRGIQSHPLARE